MKKVSNNPQHNFIVFSIAQLLSFYLSYEALGKILTDGVSMYISDKKPARQPDVIVLLNENLDKIKTTRIEGAADIVVEVVSLGSNTIDRGDKFDEYEKAGVQKYWLIDPIRKSVSIYTLDADGYYQQLGDTKTITSQLLPNFVLDTQILWQDDLPTGPALVKLVETMLD
ncbi:MAG: Uma2 family endonuclease [Chloroflexota bacterium]